MKLRITILSAILFFFLHSKIKSNEIFPSRQADEKVSFIMAKLHYSNSAGEAGLTTFDYDEKGRMRIAVWELLDGSRNSINFYTTDDKGNVTKKYREFSDGITSTQTYYYAKNGKLSSENFSRSDGISGTVRYEYNILGDPEKAVCEGLNGWFYGIIEYNCNSKGNKISGTILQNGKRTGHIEYTYDVYDNLIEEVWQLSTVWNQTFVYEYQLIDVGKRLKYNSANVFLNQSQAKVKSESYDFSGKIGGPSSYFYNNFGKLETKIFERSDGVKTTTYYLYDNSGKMIKSYRKHDKDTTAIFTFEYDSTGRMVSKSFKQPDGSLGEEQYFYDDSGRLNEMHYNNIDMWLNGKIIFTYDELSKLSSGYFIGENNFNAKIDFTYNVKNQLSKIHWKFTDGKTQTYTFEY